MTDEVSKEDITTKNIIITFARNYTLKKKKQKTKGLSYSPFVFI